MPEPIQQPIETTPVADDASSLATLRTVHAEVLAKRKRDKERITQLEARVAESETAIQELILNRPLKQMAESLSKAPDTFIESFSKDYKLAVQKDGELALLTLDDKPVMHEGKSVPFERESLMKLLLATKDESKRKLYDSILIASRASGGSAPNRSERTLAAPKDSSIQFGLR